jgi:Tfp pilus assembly protein PilF
MGRILLLLLAFLTAGCSGGPGSALRDIQDDLERAERLLEKNRFREARRVLSDVRSRHPRDWQVASSVFVFWVEGGRLDEAARAGQEMVEARDHLVEPRPLSRKEWSRIVTQVATAVMEDGDEGRSAELMELALELDSSNPDAANGVAWLLAERGQDLDRALVLARRAVRLKPEAGYIVDTLGWVYYRMNRLEEAAEWLQKSLARSTRDPTVHDHMGDVYYSMSRLKEAVQHWERSLQEWQSNAPSDMDQEEMAKIRKKLENARIRLAREGAQQKN